jgi:hypothetical protein
MEVDSVNESPSPQAPVPVQNQEGSDGTSSANPNETIALGAMTEEEYLEALKKNERAEIWDFELVSSRCY